MRTTTKILTSAILLAVASAAPAETVVNATWVGLANNASDVWSNAARWNPQIVPNNGNGTVFDVTINGQGNIGPSLESSVVIRNLSLLDGGGMSNNTGVVANLTVTDTTWFQPHPYDDEMQYGGVEVRDGTYTLGTFLNGANGILTGGTYRLEQGTLPAVMQWKNANIVENQAADLAFFGSNVAIRDQLTGQNGLRNFAINKGGFTLDGGAQFTTAGNFDNSGLLFIGGGTPFPSIPSSTMTIAGDFNNSGYLQLLGAKLTVNGDMSNSGDIYFDGSKAKIVVNGTLTQTQGTLTLGSGEIEDFRATAARIDMAAGTTLGGTGTVFADLVGRGVLSPGASPGKITVNGDVAMAATTDLKIELAGTVAGTSYDQLVQTVADTGDHATLAGTISLSAINGYVPAYGVTHRVVSASSLSGKFATVTGHQLSQNKWLAVTYDATSVNVTAAVPGDVNLSGGVGFEDLVTLAQQYNRLTGQKWSTADFTGDGATNFADLVVLAQHYNQQASLEELVTIGGESFASDWALAQSMVPEPGISLAAFGGLATLQRRCRRR